MIEENDAGPTEHDALGVPTRETGLDPNEAQELFRRFQALLEQRGIALAGPLGSGGQGIVFAAQLRNERDKPCAVKVLDPAWNAVDFDPPTGEHPVWLKRFDRFALRIADDVELRVAVTEFVSGGGVSHLGRSEAQRSAATARDVRRARVGVRERRESAAPRPEAREPAL